MEVSRLGDAIWVDATRVDPTICRLVEKICAELVCSYCRKVLRLYETYAGGIPSSVPGQDG